MSLSVRVVGDASVISVSGEVDLDNVAPLTQALASQAHSGGGAVVLDLSGIRFADSTTVNVILRANSDLGPRLRIAALSDNIERLLDLVGVREMLPVYDTVEDALTA
ncbi:STAS domain-containing protein [Streptomyces cavernae]|uniref:STAS domain-containing protein n=1 Tax=Streptomyces cavernae TaxID=2259034 RepID=UPI000FEB8887|nr:STAS domain-containing protein [Streptomyces cavernae]